MEESSESGNNVEEHQGEYMPRHQQILPVMNPSESGNNDVEGNQIQNEQFISPTVADPSESSNNAVGGNQMQNEYSVSPTVTDPSKSGNNAVRGTCNQTQNEQSISPTEAATCVVDPNESKNAAGGNQTPNET